MPDRAAAQAQEALAQAADQPVALALLKDLGWVQVDGTWVKESEALAAQGKVRYQGQVMTTAEADALKEKAKEGAARDNAQKDVEGKAAYIATIDKQLADLQKRPALLDAELAKASTALSAAQAKAHKVTQAKSAYDNAQRSLTQAQNQNAGQRQGGYGTAGNASTVNLQPLYQAVEDARKAYAQARADADGAEGEVTRQQGLVASLSEEKKNLEHKKTDLTARRVRAVKDLETAQAALAKQGGAPAAAQAHRHRRSRRPRLRPSPERWWRPALRPGGGTFAGRRGSDGYGRAGARPSRRLPASPRTASIHGCVSAAFSGQV